MAVVSPESFLHQAEAYVDSDTSFLDQNQKNKLSRFYILCPVSFSRVRVDVVCAMCCLMCLRLHSRRCATHSISWLDSVKNANIKAMCRARYPRTFYPLGAASPCTTLRLPRIDSTYPFASPSILPISKPPNVSFNAPTTSLSSKTALITSCS